MRDPYQILGVTQDATDEEIKKAYRRLCKRYHPDVNHEPSAEGKFKEIQSAYEWITRSRSGQIPPGQRYGEPETRAPPNGGGTYQNPFGDFNPFDFWGYTVYRRTGSAQQKEESDLDAYEPFGRRTTPVRRRGISLGTIFLGYLAVQVIFRLLSLFLR